MLQSRGLKDIHQFAIVQHLPTRRGCKNVGRCQSSAQAPIIDALEHYLSRDTSPFHIPGHKRGSICPKQLAAVISPATLASDLTELPGLDYLSDPSGVIAESQMLAASVFGAERTWYLVNGTSAGIQAAIMATCSPGDSILVARNCHISVFNGIVMTGCKPIWILPEIERNCNVAVELSVVAFEAAITQAHKSGHYPRAAVCVTPTYYGTCSDIQGLAALSHKHKIPLIVDEAHGGHFGFQPGFPKSAMQQGADIAVQSSHKTMTSMGQSSMLHLQGLLVDATRLSQCLSLLQTTSPSYLLLASLDGCQAYAHDWQNGRISVPYEGVLQARTVLEQIPGISLLHHSLQGQTIIAHDPWRITVNVTCLGLSGFEVEELLQDTYNVYPELATQQVVVLAVGPGTQQQHLDTLVKAFQEISSQTSHQAKAPPGTTLVPFPAPQTELSPRNAFFASKMRVPAQEAIGKPSGELLCPYPPGIPVTFPGEILSKESIDHLGQVLKLGGKVTGASDSTLNTFLIIKQ